MSLWRVRHRLSPVTEAAFIVLALCYGIFVIYMASIQPMVVALTADIRSVPGPVSLDTDTWGREVNAADQYMFGIPKGWSADMSDLDHVAVSSSRREMGAPGPHTIVIDSDTIGERSQVENIAAGELAGLRVALYDIAVHGRPALFAVQSVDGRIARQIVYVQVGDRLYIIRAGAMDPAVFSAFVSTVKFLPAPEEAP